MRRITSIRGLSLIIFCLAQLVVFAQLKTGRTATPDTSFSLSKEYDKLKKDYPFLKAVYPSPSKAVREKRNIVYCTNAKRNLFLDAFYPAFKTREKRTAVLFIHGGGWRSGNKTQHHPFAQRMAELGYVSFTPEYRLSTEALYPAAVYDLKAAIRWIHANAKAYHVDTNKIIVAGFSAGGQLAALLGTTMGVKSFEGNGCHLNYSSNVQAIVALDGVLAFVHPESGEGDDTKKISAATQWFGYPKNERPQLWKDASALMHVSSATPPTLFINSSVARMHAGRDDYRKILSMHGVYSELKTFETAPHSFPLFQPWFDSTVQVVDKFLNRVFAKPAYAAPTIIVAQDGSGNYITVQEAFNAVSPNNQRPITIYIKSGIYKEKLLLDSSKKFVTVMGEDKFSTILTYDDHTGRISPKGDTINTYSSHSFLEAADDFTARNVTFQNTAGFSAGQAVAIQILGDRAKFINCRFIGNQDVLFPSRINTRQYFERCYIEGTTDFIFGPSTAWFEGCHIHSKKNSHITAASTPKEFAFGYVFNDCVLTGDTSLHNVSLGRPWRPYASVVFMNSYIGGHIKPEGWSNWNNTDNYLTTRYAEYKNYGPSFDPLQRVKWSKQLNNEEIKKYTIPNVLGNWNPK